MNNLEHIVAIVQPTGRDDSTIDIARDVVAGGGRATVIMLITDRVRKDIRDFADAENLSIGEAEAIALDRMSADYVASIGAGQTDVVVSNVSDAQTQTLVNATKIAVGQDALSRHALNQLVSRANVPVIVTPPRAA